LAQHQKIGRLFALTRGGSLIGDIDVSEQGRTTKTSLATAAEIARVYRMRHFTDTIFTRGQWHKYHQGTWNPVHDLILDKEIWDALEEFEGQGRCKPATNTFNAVMSNIRSNTYVEEILIDQSSNLINLMNGVYNLDDSTLYEHDPKYYFTTQLPFEYRPNASYTWWQVYLETTFVKPETHETDIELIEFVQEAIGYSLTSDVRQHVTFWCLGVGSNGKGTLFHVLERLTGPAFFPINVKLLGQNPYQLAELGNKRIAACSEANATDNLIDDAQIKALVAGDTMPARSPHQRPFSLHPHVKLWWSMNQLPPVADSSEGFWRRVRVIPFNRMFEGKEKIIELQDYLDLELSGIFNWAMEGLRRLNSRGHFDEPPQVTEITAKYRHEANPVSLFIEDECTTEKELVRCSGITEVYQAYRGWCQLNGYRPVASRRFRNEMSRLGYPVRWRNPPLDKALIFVGIRWKNAILI
jgi:putative DNA primase/helicase